MRNGKRSGHLQSSFSFLQFFCRRDRPPLAGKRPAGTFVQKHDEVISRLLVQRFRLLSIGNLELKRQYLVTLQNQIFLRRALENNNNKKQKKVLSLSLFHETMTTSLNVHNSESHQNQNSKQSCCRWNTARHS